MPEQMYELIAQGARYWFLLLMVLITWRTFVWYSKDKRQYHKRLRLLPDAGYIGELIVVDGQGRLADGTVFMLPREGTLGQSKINDIRLKSEGIARQHLWFHFEDGAGLEIQPFRGCEAWVDGYPAVEKGDPVFMLHGSRLTIGGMELVLRLFAGFESASAVPQEYGDFSQNDLYRQEDAAYAPDQMYPPMQNVPTAYPPAPDAGFAGDPVWNPAPCAPEQGSYASPEPVYQQAEPPAQSGVYLSPAEYAALRQSSSPETAEIPADRPDRETYLGVDESEMVTREVWDRMFKGGGRS